jgi:hypothetical protein
MLGVSSGVASATPASGVDSRRLPQSSEGGRDFIVRGITIGPGSSTGWHWHIGTNLGQTPVILEVLYVDPVNKPAAEDAPNPGYPFA